MLSWWSVEVLNRWPDDPCDHSTVIPCCYYLSTLWDGSLTLIAASANGASPEAESVVMGLRKEGLMSSSSGGAVPGTLRGDRWGSELWSWYFLYELFIGTTCCILAASPSLPPSTVMLSHSTTLGMSILDGDKANGALGHYAGEVFCPLFSLRGGLARDLHI